MSDQQKFEAVLAESVSFLSSPQAANVPEAVLAVKATSNLLDTVLEIIKTLGTQAAVYLPQIKAAALAVYDSQIAPIDIAFIPNNVEPFVDEMLRSALEKGLDALIAALPTFAASQTAAATKVAELRADLPA